MVECKIEPLSYMLLNGLIEMGFKAWEEMEHEHPGVAYNPNWEAYQRMESEDSLRFFALRDEGKLLGYATIIIDKDIHRNDIVFASFRDIYIAKEKRGHAAKFVRFIEDVLSSVGVKRVYASERLGQGKAGKFYQALGFEPQECVWGKTLH